MPRAHSLIPHAEMADGLDLVVSVHVERQDGRLWLRYVVEGDVDAVQWPRDAVPERTNGLWARTCFEAFVQTDDGYREFNLSPSGQWAAYRFAGYRDGMADADETASVLGLDGARDMVALEALIDEPLRSGLIGLSAVIEDRKGGISYWALAHPSDKPDFHHPDSFTLDLP